MQVIKPRLKINFYLSLNKHRKLAKYFCGTQDSYEQQKSSVFSCRNSNKNTKSDNKINAIMGSNESVAMS